MTDPLNRPPLSLAECLRKDLMDSSVEGLLDASVEGLPNASVEDLMGVL